jgi:hypothetical protein
MLSAIFITFFFIAALGSAQRTSRSDELIVHHPYNDRHNDAAGAREDYVG